MIKYSLVRRRIEFGAAFCTGLIHILLQGTRFTSWVIISAAVLWIIYITWRIRIYSRVLSIWGFRTDNLASAFKWPTLIFGVASLSMGIFGYINGTLSWHWHILVLLLVYPLWGALQQFLVQGLCVGHLIALSEKKWIAVVLGAALFSAVHYPRRIEMVATGGLTCMFIPLYLKDRNLWPLGLYHGWLGTLFHVWILDRDPWVEVFG